MNRSLSRAESKWHQEIHGAINSLFVILIHGVKQRWAFWSQRRIYIAAWVPELDKISQMPIFISRGAIWGRNERTTTQNQAMEHHAGAHVWPQYSVWIILKTPCMKRRNGAAVISSTSPVELRNVSKQNHLNTYTIGACIWNPMINIRDATWLLLCACNTT